MGQLGTKYHPRDKRWLAFSHNNGSAKPDPKKANSRSNKSIDVHNGGFEIISTPSEPQNLSRNKLVSPGAKSPGNDVHQRYSCVNWHTSPPGSRSATPYTWSESEPSGPQVGHAIEDSLLAVFTADLAARADVENLAVDPKRQYYDLKDLQDILETRKTMWAEEASGVYPASRISSLFISRLVTSASPCEQWAQACHGENMIEDDLNEDVLFQQLDILLQDIVSSEGKRPTSKGEKLEILPTQRGSWQPPKAEFDPQFHQDTKEAHCDYHHMLPCDRTGPVTDTFTSLRGTLPAVRAGLSLGPRTTSNSKYFQSFLTGSSTEQRMSQQFGLAEGGSHRLFPAVQPVSDQNTFPHGFWRQNKLY